MPPHPRNHPYVNIGIYLDDADSGDGCLYYVPGTHEKLQDISSLTRNYGWNLPGMVEQAANAGDMLIHDIMVLHGSQPKQAPGCRRTIYIEMRPLAGILQSAVQSTHWAELRKRWMGLVVRRAAPNEWPVEWQDDIPQDLRSDAEEAEAIKSHWEAPIPAHYATPYTDANNTPKGRT